ncbi:ABC transporter substrate-binding protein [Cellulomonas hominis]
MRSHPHYARVVPALAAVVALTASAGCSGDSPASGSSGATGGSDADEPVTISFTWWGNDERAAITQDAIDAFEVLHPNITVEGQPAAFDGYFDKLATTTAAGDAPDVITFGGAYVLEYAARGALVDLADVADQLDVTPFDENILSNATYDGGVYGVPTGGNAGAIIANPALFEAAGVPMPDDDTWTWDDFADIAKKISDASPDGTYGAEIRPPDMIGTWAAQRGTPMYTADGEVGVTPDVLADFWQMTLDLQESGAAPSAEITQEVVSASPEQTLAGQGRAAMVFGYSNQVETYSTASGQDLVLLRYPGETEFKRTGLSLLPSQFYGIYSKSEHPEAAATFIDFLVNSTEAGVIIRNNRGMPGNQEVLDAISGDLGPFGDLEADYLARVLAEADPSPMPPQPAGGGIQDDLTKRVFSDVLFGRTSPEQGAEQWIQELSDSIASA